jgi:cold shock CspA family protein
MTDREASLPLRSENGKRTGVITFESDRGFFFCEDLRDHLRVFIHTRQLIDARYLHAGDLVEFDRVASQKHPDRFDGINVRYVGHVEAETVRR